MLQQFTWQQFLIAAMIFTLIWYAGVLLLFYRKEFKVFLSGGSARITGSAGQEPLPHRWEKGVEQIDPENELIGRAKLPDGMSSVSMAGIGFVPDEKSREQQVGLVPDVLAEIKSIFGVLEKQDGSKRDFFILMEAVRESFPRIGASPNIASINGFIAENAPFHLSAEELENLWG